MSDEFEKKSSKKGGIIALIVILLIAVIAGTIYYFFFYKKNPDKVFEKAIEDTFEMSEKEKKDSVRVELELSAELESNDAQVRMINTALKAIKVKQTTEMNRKENIINNNIVVTYEDDEVINASALYQNDAMYLYLKDLYSKFIKVDTKYLESEGLDLSKTLEKANDVKGAEKLVKDIKEIFLNTVKDKKVEQEEVELNGEKVQKSTLKLSAKELGNVLEQVLTKINEYTPSEDIEDFIDDIKDSKDDLDDEEIYLEVSIYTKGIKNDVVKAEITLANNDEDEAFGLEIDKKSDNEIVINILVNEDSTKVKNANKVADITIKKESENNGIITLSMDIEGVKAKVNMKYKVDYDAKVEAKDVRNNISVEDLTEEDEAEIMKNIQNNQLLYSLIQMFSIGNTLNSVTNGVTMMPNYNY